MIKSQSKACCLPFLSFKKQKGQVNNLDATQTSTRPKILNDNEKTSSQTYERANEVFNLYEPQKSLIGVNQSNKSNKIAPQYHIKIQDSFSEKLNDQSTTTNAITKSQYSRKDYTCNAISQSGFSSLIGSPEIKPVYNKNIKIKQYQDENLQLKSTNLQRMQLIDSNQIAKKIQSNDLKSKDNFFFSNQQEVKFLESCMQNSLYPTQNREQYLITDMPEKQNISDIKSSIPSQKQKTQKIQMIANQTNEIIDQIFLDLKQKNQENVNNMVKSNFLNTQFNCVEKAEKSGRVKQLNISNYSMCMQDQSVGVYDEDGSICRIGSCIQFENNHQTRENNYKGEEIKKLPYRIPPQINNNNQERDSDQVIIKSPIQIQKYSQSNKKSELNGNQFNHTEFNDNKSHISQTCLKTPYIQSLSRQQEIKNSKQTFSQSNINYSITRESQLDILEEESYTDSISSLDLEDAFY
eukprot:403341099